MNTCPACSKTVHPNDLVCPHCGINLHPGTATAGPASGGGGMGMSVIAIVVIALAGIVLLFACGGAALWFFLDAPVMAPPPSAPPTTIKRSLPVEPLEQLPVLEAPDDRLQVGEPPAQGAIPEKSTETP